MTPVKLCPACHKAEPLVKTEWTQVGPDGVDVAASVTIPIRLCGRCGIEVARAALNAAMMKLAALRRGRMT